MRSPLCVLCVRPAAVLRISNHLVQPPGPTIWRKRPRTRRSPNLSISLSLATYNIHRCFGTDGHCLPERTAEVIAAQDVHIVGLQEVDTRLQGDGRTQLEYLAETLGMHAVAGGNRKGKFDNALLSCWPVRNVRCIDLTIHHFKPRGAIECDIDVNGRIVRVVVSHLGLDAGERRRQVRRLLRYLEDHPADAPLVVMGDFNEWKPTRGTLRGLDRRLGPSRMPRTFPSRLPLLPLDRVWAWPQASLQRLAVYTTPLSRITSDHLPLRAEIAWPGIARPDSHEINRTTPPPCTTGLLYHPYKNLSEYIHSHWDELMAQIGQSWGCSFVRD